MVLMISEIWLTETPGDGGQHLLHHSPDAGIAQIETRQHQHADLFQVRQLIK